MARSPRPSGFKEAYDQFVAGGWQGLSHPAEYGGQGLPMSMGMLKSEMMGTGQLVVHHVSRA